MIRQRPAVHAAVEGEFAEHASPQAPQLLLLVCLSTHAPLHQDSPDEQMSRAQRAPTSASLLDGVSLPRKADRRYAPPRLK